MCTPKRGRGKPGLPERERRGHSRAVPGNRERGESSLTEKDDWEKRATHRK